jgi:hypothetical protein
MICEYTIYDTADMYMNVAFPIHETDNVHTKTPNRIYVNHHRDTKKERSEWKNIFNHNK